MARAKAGRLSGSPHVGIGSHKSVRINAALDGALSSRKREVSIFLGVRDDDTCPSCGSLSKQSAMRRPGDARDGPILTRAIAVN